MVQDIVEATKRSKEILADIRKLSTEQLTRKMLLPLLRQAVLYKLMIGENEEESSIRNLIVLSIKLQDKKSGNLSDEVIRNQVSKYDCHQTSLVAQKKVLLLMYLERELGFHMSDEDAVSMETMEDMAKIFTHYMKAFR